MSETRTRCELHIQTNYSFNNGVRTAADFLEFAWANQIKSISITDYMSMQAFPEAYSYCRDMAAAGRNINLIYGCEILVYNDSVMPGNLKAMSFLVYPKNISGLHVLYRLLSQAFAYTHPHILLSDLIKQRKNLIIMTAAEMAKALVQDDVLFSQLAKYTDYLEVCPFMEPKLVQHICLIARKYKIPVVATSAAYLISRSDAVYLDVLRGERDWSDNVLSHRFHNISELENHFDFLDRMKDEIIFANPQKLIGEISVFEAFTDLSTAKGEKALGKIAYLARKEAHRHFGKILPNKVALRINNEIRLIRENDYAENILIAHELAIYCLGEKISFSCLSNSGSLLIIWLLGISEVNPLPAFYLCPECFYIKFYEKYSSGFDMPAAKCLHCGHPMLSNGHNIPENIVLCTKYPHLTDFTFTVAPGRENHLLDHLRRKYGQGKIVNAGYIKKLTRSEAENRFNNYRKKYSDVPYKLKNLIISHITDARVNKETAALPVYYVVPTGKESYHYTPVHFLEDIQGKQLIVSHLPETEISRHLSKITILASEKMQLSQFVKDSNLSDRYSLSFSLNLLLTAVKSSKQGRYQKKEVINLLDIPEFRYGSIREIITAVNPVCYSDLLKSLAFANGIDSWSGNADLLLKNKKHKLANLIATKEDLFHILKKYGADDTEILPLVAFAGNYNDTRKNTDSYAKKIAALTGSTCYARSYAKIKYLPSRAVIAGRLLQSLRYIWYKYCNQEVFSQVKLKNQNIPDNKLINIPISKTNYIQITGKRIRKIVLSYAFICSRDILPLDEKDILNDLISLPDGTVKYFKFSGSYEMFLSYLQGLLFNYQSGYLLLSVSSSLSIASIMRIWQIIEDKKEIKINVHFMSGYDIKATVYSQALLSQ